MAQGVAMENKELINSIMEMIKAKMITANTKAKYSSLD